MNTVYFQIQDAVELVGCLLAMASQYFEKWFSTLCMIITSISQSCILQI